MTEKQIEEFKKIEEEMKKAADRIQVSDWETRREELLKRIHEAEKEDK